MPTETDVLNRFGNLEGRVSVVEQALEFGNKEFERMNETVVGIRKDLKDGIIAVKSEMEKKIDEAKEDMKSFHKWVQGIFYSVTVGVILFLADMVKDFVTR